jgi:hypothetical protein
MNISNLRATSSLKPLTRPSLYWTFADALVLAKRHLIQIPRIPEELIFATIQPIMLSCSSATCLAERSRSVAPVMSTT